MKYFFLVAISLATLSCSPKPHPLRGPICKIPEIPLAERISLDHTVYLTGPNTHHSGTGTRIKFKGKPYILTAAHVCYGENLLLVVQSAAHLPEPMAVTFVDLSVDVCLLDGVGTRDALDISNASTALRDEHVVGYGYGGGFHKTDLIISKVKYSEEDYDIVHTQFWCYIAQPAIIPGDSGTAFFNDAGEFKGLGVMRDAPTSSPTSSLTYLVPATTIVSVLNHAEQLK